MSDKDSLDYVMLNKKINKCTSVNFDERSLHVK